MFPVIVDCLVRSAELALLAVGVTMVYGLLRFANFAHLEFAAIGAYLALFFSSALGLPLPVAGGLAIVVTGGIGVASDILIFRKLRAAAPIMLVIASFALGIVFRETIRAIWGPSPFFYDVGIPRPWVVGGFRVTPTQVVVVGAAIAAMLSLHFLLKRTRLGIAMRATADNGPLAQACGVGTEGIVRMVWFVGAAFAGLGGVLVGLNTQVKADMGGGLVVEVFAAAIVGGIGNPYGAMLGAVLIGFSENIGLAVDWGPLIRRLGFESGDFVFIPTGYKAVIPFFLLVVALLIRPQGLLGHRR